MFLSSIVVDVLSHVELRAVNNRLVKGLTVGVERVLISIFNLLMALWQYAVNPSLENFKCFSPNLIGVLICS